MSEFAVGDVVVRLDGPLACGSGVYGDAVVIKTHPLTLASRKGDMRWSTTIPNMTLRKVGRLNWWQRRAAMRRANG